LIILLINFNIYKYAFFRKGDELPLSSIRRYITEYIKKYELQDKTDPSYVFFSILLPKLVSNLEGGIG